MRPGRLLAFALAGGLAAACGGSSSPSAPASPGTVEQVSVSVSYLVGNLSMSPMYVADDLGYFKKRGITNQYDTAGNPSDKFPLQSQGKLDVNIVGTGGAFFNAIGQGLKFRAVADRVQYRCSSDQMLLVRTSLYPAVSQSASALKGKKVAIVSRGTATEYWLDVWLEKNGLKESDLGSVQVLPLPSQVTAFKTGAIDAGFVSQPLAYQALSDGSAKRVIGVNEIVPNAEIGEITFSDDFISRNGGKDAASWLAAWLEGVRYFEDPRNRTSVIQTVSKWTKADAAVIDKLYGTDQWIWMDPNGEVDTRAIESQDVPWLISHKVIQQVPATKDYYNPGPIRAAQKEAGKVTVKRDCAAVPHLQG